jgi:hypothetical protein
MEFPILCAVRHNFRITQKSALILELLSYHHTVSRFIWLLSDGLFIVISPRASPPALSEFGLICVLPSLDAFWLSCGSAFGATAYDDAHGAFMTLHPYTRSREGEACQLRSGTKFYWLGLCVKSRSPCSSDMLAHHALALTGLQPVCVYVTTCHQ